MIVLLQRVAHRAAFRVLCVWWFLARPSTHGVKLVLQAGEEILFVRHTYGDRAVWELPGGGRRRGEPPPDAARREAREELGIDVGDWTPFGLVVDQDRATANLTCLSARHDGSPLRLARGEIAESRWCPPSAPPQPLGRHAAAVLALPEYPAVPAS